MEGKSTREIGLEKGYLMNKKVFIKPNTYPQPMLVNQKSHAMNFIGDGCIWCFCLAKDYNRNELINPFESEEERKYFEGIFGRSLNHRDFDHNYWEEAVVKIEKSNELMAGRKYLDLSNPDDNIRYRILKSCTKDFANGQADFELDNSRKFILLFEEETLKKTSKDLTDHVDVWIEIGKIRSSKSEMIKFLTLFNSYKRTGKIIPEDNESEWYETAVMECVKDSMDICVKIVQNKDRAISELIADGLLCNAVIRKGVAHLTLPGLADSFMMDDFIKYLNSIKGDPIYLTLEAQVNAFRESRIKVRKPKQTKE